MNKKQLVTDLLLALSLTFCAYKNADSYSYKDLHKNAIGGYINRLHDIFNSLSPEEQNDPFYKTSQKTADNIYTDFTKRISI